MSTGTGGILCGYCGRPMLAGVSVGGQMYHEECTRGPGWQPPTYAPPAPSPWPHYTAPVGPALSEADVRRIVQEEVMKALANYKPVLLVTFGGNPAA